MTDQRDDSAYEPGAVFAAFLRAHGGPVPVDPDPPPASEADYAKALAACRQAFLAANAARAPARPDLFEALRVLVNVARWHTEVHEARGPDDRAVPVPLWAVYAIAEAWDAYESEPELALDDAFGLRDAGRQGARDPRGKQATLARNRNLALDIATIEKVGPGPGFNGPPEKLAYAIAAIAERSGVAAPSLEKLWQPLAEAARAAVARQMAAFGLGVETPLRA